jgi:hypothetical protein
MAYQVGLRLVEINCIESANAFHPGTARRLYVTPVTMAHDTHEGIVMFTNLKQARREEAADDAERREIARSQISGKRTQSACIRRAPQRRVDPTLLLMFMLAAAVCAMGILAIQALSI